MTQAEALREAAKQLEHDAEFNIDRTLRWSAARQAENNRRISQSRELYDRADHLDRLAKADAHVEYFKKNPEVAAFADALAREV